MGVNNTISNNIVCGLAFIQRSLQKGFTPSIFMTCATSPMLYHLYLEYMRNGSTLDKKSN